MIRRLVQLVILSFVATTALVASVPEKRTATMRLELLGACRARRSAASPPHPEPPSAHSGSPRETGEAGAPAGRAVRGGDARDRVRARAVDLRAGAPQRSDPAPRTRCNRPAHPCRCARSCPRRSPGGRSCSTSWRPRDRRSAHVDASSRARGPRRGRARRWSASATSSSSCSWASSRTDTSFSTTCPAWRRR